MNTNVKYGIYINRFFSVWKRNFWDRMSSKGTLKKLEHCVEWYGPVGRGQGVRIPPKSIVPKIVRPTEVKCTGGHWGQRELLSWHRSSVCEDGMFWRCKQWAFKNDWNRKFYIYALLQVKKRNYGICMFRGGRTLYKAKQAKQHRQRSRADSVE